MLRDETRLDETTVLKNISGISELQCLHRCRRNPECKTSAYEKSADEQLSTCFLLKDVKASNNIEGSPVRLHVPQTRKLLTHCIPY